MYGAIQCNEFSIMDNDLNGIAFAIYLRASMANHSCDYNCIVVFDERKLQLRTIKDVKDGEECTISYVDVINPAKERQAKLEEEYHFTCKCVKCVEEINASGPVDDGLGELELQSLMKSSEQIQDAAKSQDILFFAI
ncbi:histone-lysine N-methyltransferase SMYD3-like [Strongylocentrotus purpuratus]|uniref:SET domain-containing protein n=1 Tax=Strongylocentrotus purpuratus TaxID=7668 RepID=A0A7M7T4W0_STRPU|nr:histone-lysine N-methyltransferase SMYD3-like [Strongylocentrotus purpuratus]